MVAKNYVPPVITIHSWNPEGAKRMQQTFADAGYEAIVRPFDPYEHGFTY
jgi:hypothetical protein